MRQFSPSRASKSESHAREPRDLHQLVTDAIVARIEQGTRPWVQSWTNTERGVGLVRPRRHNGEGYRGINLLLLWIAMAEAGWRSPYFFTFKQAMAMKASVRKGAKGTMVFFYGSANVRPKENVGGSDDETTYRFLKSFSVFNAEQIEGLPETYAGPTEPVAPVGARIDEIEAMVGATGAVIRYGGNRACYDATLDRIRMPDFEQFLSAELYYATLMHELVHWTKVPDRLDRRFGPVLTFGDENYAKEELVAELGAAFLGADFGFAAEHLDDHASYLTSWLQALKNDKKLIFVAAAKAQQAVNYLTAGSPTPSAE